jgi:hypothetical protein
MKVCEDSALPNIVETTGSPAGAGLVFTREHDGHDARGLSGVARVFAPVLHGVVVVLNFPRTGGCIARGVKKGQNMGQKKAQKKGQKKIRSCVQPSYAALDKWDRI